LQLSAIAVLGVVSFTATFAATSWRSFTGDLRWLASASRGV
jgi:hypothetical protein